MISAPVGRSHSEATTEHGVAPREQELAGPVSGEAGNPDGQPSDPHPSATLVMDQGTLSAIPDTLTPTAALIGPGPSPPSTVAHSSHEESHLEEAMSYAARVMSETEHLTLDLLRSEPRRPRPAASSNAPADVHVVDSADRLEHGIALLDDIDLRRHGCHGRKGLGGDRGIAATATNRSVRIARPLARSGRSWHDTHSIRRARETTRTSDDHEPRHRVTRTPFEQEVLAKFSRPKFREQCRRLGPGRPGRVTAPHPGVDCAVGL